MAEKQERRRQEDEQSRRPNNDDDDKRARTSSSPSSFDVVIVGGGPGSIGLLYGLLATNDTTGCEHDKKKDFRIAVIERGDDERRDDEHQQQHGGGEHNARYPRHHHRNKVRNWFFSAHHGSGSWVHPTAPQKSLNSRVLEVAMGTGMGGSTNINACLLTEPDYDFDFDNWPGLWRGGQVIRRAIQEMKGVMERNGGTYEWKVCDRYLQSIGGTRRGACRANEEEEDGPDVGASSEGRGGGAGGGELPKQKPRFTDKFLLASNKNLDRVSYYESVLYPLLASRPDLRSRVTFFRGVIAERITVDEKEEDGGGNDKGDGKKGLRATGVVCSRRRRKGSSGSSQVGSGEDDDGGGRDFEVFTVRATSEVILCAGAIFSPALLQVSGVGGHAEEAGGVEGHRRLHHLSGVGMNLRDHLILPRAFLTPPQIGGNISSNCTQAWYMVDVRRRRPQSARAKDGEESMPGTSVCSADKSDDCSGDVFRFQMNLTDGAISRNVLPHFTASVFRIGFENGDDDRSSSAAEQSGGVKSNRASYWYYSFLNFGCWSLFVLVRFAMEVAFTYTPARFLVTYCTSSINMSLMNPTSTGTVTIVPRAAITSGTDARNPATCRPAIISEDEEFNRGNSMRPDGQGRHQPLLRDYKLRIDPGYLSNERDRRALVAGWRVTDIIAQRDFCRCIELMPGPLYRCIGWYRQWQRQRQRGGTAAEAADVSILTDDTADDEYNVTWFHRFAALPYYHWCGTCAMGVTKEEEDEYYGGVDDNDKHSSNLSVVNDRLQVHGVEGLRVCDASVFPSCISAPTALTCVGLGCATSRIILEDNGWD